jgi:hypothetical protein
VVPELSERSERGEKRHPFASKNRASSRQLHPVPGRRWRLGRSFTTVPQRAVEQMNETS